MGSIEPEKVFLPQDQFHIISRSAPTNGLSIGFTRGGMTLTLFRFVDGESPPTFFGSNAKLNEYMLTSPLSMWKRLFRILTKVAHSRYDRMLRHRSRWLANFWLRVPLRTTEKRSSIEGLIVRQKTPPLKESQSCFASHYRYVHSFNINIALNYRAIKTCT